MNTGDGSLQAVKYLKAGLDLAYIVSFCSCFRGRPRADVLLINHLQKIGLVREHGNGVRNCLLG